LGLATKYELGGVLSTVRRHLWLKFVHDQIYA